MSTSFVIPVQKQTDSSGTFTWTEDACITTQLNAAFPHKEGYILEVTPSGIEIEAQTEAGAFYAQQTLRALRTLHGDTLSCTRIEDWPEFSVRGVYFDVSRGKVPTVDSIKEVIEDLARWKINQFQLYIENVFTFKKHPEIGEGYSPLTPENLKEIEACCEANHMRFVPSLTSFGHFEKILGLEKYKHLAELPGHLGYPGGTTLNPGHPESIQLVKDLYDEFIPLFNDAEFNICCDEPWELGQGASKEEADKRGKGPVFLDFVLKLYELVKAQGKQVQMWADIVLEHPELMEKFPKDVIMINWEYTGNLCASGRMGQCDLFDKYGLQWIAAPGISSWNSNGTESLNAMNNIRGFADIARKHHALGILNTHWGDNGARTPHGTLMQNLAYGAAHSWNGLAIDETSFTETFVADYFGPGHDDIAQLIQEVGDTDGPSLSKLYLCHTAAIAPQRDSFKEIDPSSPVRFQWSDINGYIGVSCPQGCARIADQLSETLARSIDTTNLTDAQKLCVEEMQLAGYMDLVAAKKVILGQRQQKGDAISSDEWNALAKELDEVTDAFEANWLVRNQPSRLADNLTILRSAAQECRDFAES